MLKFITKEEIIKSVCNSNSTLSTGVMYGYGMIHLPSASAMDVRLQSPAPS